MRIVQLLSLFLMSTLIFSEDSVVPNPSNDCKKMIKKQSYCIESSVINKSVQTMDGNRNRVIKIEVHVLLNSGEYETVDAVIERYFDFSMWDNYTDQSDMLGLNWIHSASLEKFIDENQKIIRPHYMRYRLFGLPPLDFIVLNISELSLNYEIGAFSGADRSFTYEMPFHYPYQLPEIGQYNSPESVLYKTGSVHVKEHVDEDGDIYFTLYNVTYAVPAGFPELTYPKVADALANGLESVFVGMFNLN